MLNDFNDSKMELQKQQKLQFLTILYIELCTQSVGVELNLALLKDS